MHQNGGLCESCFEGFKHLGVVGAPDEWGVLVVEMNQGYDNVGEPHNESAIKVGKTQESLDCLEVSRVGQMLTVSVLAVSIEIPVGVTIKPRNSIFCNKHFSGLECKSYSQRCSKMLWMWT